MNDAWGRPDREVGVTIKYGKGYDDSWVTFRGSPSSVREDVIAFFGLDGASVAGLTTSEVVVNATQVAHGKGAAASVLGATVISSTTTTTLDKPAAAAEAKESETPAVNPIFAMIENCTSVEDLKRLWAEYQPFAEDVMAAWKARGKALQNAA